MARKIRTLSQSAVIQLQRMDARLSALEQKRGGSVGTVDAKSVYIVRTPSGGIPKATIGSERVPGSATCTMFRRLKTTGNTDKVSTIDKNQTVYNFTDTNIPGLSIILVYRDAWGDVWAMPNTGTCPDLPSPGSYPAIAGAEIAAGATGNVVYDGVIYSAVNQSQCNVVIGDKLGLHVSPNCEAFFVPCVCSCSQVTPTPCCDKFIAICINGYVQILAVDGGSAQWTLTDCCECDSTPTVTITMSCTGSTVTASWEYTCGATTDSGTIDFSAVCTGTTVEDTVTMDVCNVTVTGSATAEDCLGCNEGPCDDPDNCVTTDCCPDNPVPKELTAVVTGGAFAGSYGMTYAAGEWVIDGAPGFTLRLSCLGGGNFWELIVEMETYGEDTAVCDPFALTFDTSVPPNGAGITAVSIS